MSSWEKLNLIRVYTKPKGKQPDYEAPVVLRANKCTVEDFVCYPLPFPPLPPFVFGYDMLTPNPSAMPSTRASSSSSSAPSFTENQSSISRSAWACHMSWLMKILLLLLSGKVFCCFGRLLGQKIALRRAMWRAAVCR